MNAKFVFGIFAALALIAIMAGSAFFAFNAGVAQGSSVDAAAQTSGNDDYYAMPFHHPAWFGPACFWFFAPLCMIICAVKAVYFIFRGPRPGYHARRRGWHDWDDCFPWFHEQREHGSEESAGEKKKE